jgi:hypothetical protein
MSKPRASFLYFLSTLILCPYPFHKASNIFSHCRVNKDSRFCKNEYGGAELRKKERQL